MSLLVDESRHFFVFLRLLANISKDATIYIEYVSIDSIGGMGGQEHGGTAQLLGIEPATSRCLRTDERVERMTAAVGLRFTQRCRLRRGDVAWANGVTLNVIAAILGTDVSCEHLQSTLGSSVGADGLTA